MKRCISFHFTLPLCICMAWVLTQVLPCAAQEDVSKLGIFNATADWGLEPEFGPKIREHKVPGRVEVSGTVNDIVYDAYGNGDNIWIDKDEGYYVYREKSGSWSFTTKVKWIEKGGAIHQFAKAGLMIRVTANSPTSEHYAIYLISGFEKPLGSMIHPGWRRENGAWTYPDTIGLNILGCYVKQPGRAVYLRLTRFTPEEYIIAEYSEDGSTWNFLHRSRLPMAEQVAYGLVVSNEADNELLAHVQFSDVSFDAPATQAWRFFNPKYYRLDDSVDVEINVLHASDEDGELIVREAIPKEWSVNYISHEGSWNDGEIVWRLNDTGESVNLRYSVYPPDPCEGEAVFKGTAGASQIYGMSNISEKPLLSIDEVVSKVTTRASLVVTPLLMLFLHLSLFLFYPRLKENLYFSLFLVSYHYN